MQKWREKAWSIYHVSYTSSSFLTRQHVFRFANVQNSSTWGRSYTKKPQPRSFMGAPPSYVHLVSTWCYSCGEWDPWWLHLVQTVICVNIVIWYSRKILLFTIYVLVWCTCHILMCDKHRDGVFFYFFILQVHANSHNTVTAKSYPLYKFIQHVQKLLSYITKEADLSLHNVIVLCNHFICTVLYQRSAEGKVACRGNTKWSIRTRYVWVKNELSSSGT